jgi:hypothetical protein
VIAPTPQIAPYEKCRGKVQRNKMASIWSQK